jgi:hypothetical protein
MPQILDRLDRGFALPPESFRKPTADYDGQQSLLILPAERATESWLVVDRDLEAVLVAVIDTNRH